MRSVILSLIVCLSLAPASLAQHHSALWGENGENWSPTSRLPDVSYAGYRQGEAPIPDVPVAANIKDFGAVGDGEHDDSEAFLKAIEEVESGAILIPDGTYMITEILEIRKPNLVLRGESRDGTILFFPKYLNDIEPNWGATTSGRRTSNYSWSGGFIWLKGSYQSERLASVTEAAQRGDQWIAIDSTEDLSVGQWIDVFQSDTEDNTLARHLYTDQPGEMEEIRGRTNASIASRILEIDGNKIKLQRPLRFDLQERWDPRVRRFAPTLQESGVENLTFRYPVTPYEGHFTELGYNAIAFYRAVNCWVRNIRIQHADSGLFIRGRFNTVDGVLYESDREPDNRNDTGHHGLTFSGDDNLFTNFTFQTSFIHDITVTHCAGNVISNGEGVDLSLDHHKRVPYANVFTNLDAGKGNQVWRCGGGRALGKHCAGYGTFWNIRAENPIQYPRDNFGPDSMNIVALTTDQPSITQQDGKWFEVIDPESIEPQNIHQAQLEYRLRHSDDSAPTGQP